MNPALVVIGIFVALFAFSAALIFIGNVSLWIKARASGVPLSLFQIIGMRLRHVPPDMIIDSAINLWNAGIDVAPDDLESHVLSGGNLRATVVASISADKSGLGYNFQQIAALDLAGRDVADAIQTSVEPRVLECPGKRGERIRGVAKDGIRLGVTVRVTIRTNLSRLIGGASDETIRARVGEGIVACVGAAESHKSILEEPERIAKHILGRGLDSGTAFEIVSVDVMDVDVEDNIGARLAEEQADADQRIAQAKAEMRRMFAVAKEQEMNARITEMTTQLTLSEAEVPTALASALNEGRVWRSPRPVYPPFGRRLWDCSEERPA